MLLPPALASGCHPAHTDARGGGSTKTLLFQQWGKVKQQQSTICNRNNNNIKTLWDRVKSIIFELYD